MHNAVGGDFDSRGKGRQGFGRVEAHAHAHQCQISLALDEALLTLEVCDDGRGLPTRRRSGIGLTSMRERAEELGGTFEIESTPGHGTTLRACLPLPDED